MPTTVTTPEAPILSTIPGVELIHAGTWNISTGTWDVTADDLAAAVGALDCPAVRRPVLKLGHTDPRFDGEPAVGWVANLATSTDGLTLVGDYTGMPAWLAEVAASAYPDRSVEGQYDYVCQIGHTHPFVLTAVALLGVTPPGVGTLASLQDVAALYGVAAATPDDRPGLVVITSTGASMPTRSRPLAPAASVSTEDVRRAYYDHAPWSVWIVEQQLEPLQLIVCDDDNGTYARVPVEVAADDTVTFGAPVPVRRVYVDAPTADDVAAASGSIVFASRRESRPAAAAAATAPATAPVPGSQEGAGMDPALLREALGLAPDASDQEVTAAISAAGLATPAAPDLTSLPAPDPATALAPAAAASEPWRAELERTSSELAQIRAERAAETRDRVIGDAVRAGKITPAERESWEARYTEAPTVITDILASMAPGTAVPINPAGYAGTPDDSEADSEYVALYGTKEA